MSAAHERSRPRRVATNVSEEVIDYIYEEAERRGCAYQKVTRELIMAGFAVLRPVASPSQENAA